MLQSPKFEFENKSTIYQAISHTKQGSANFADYLIGAINYEHKYIHTVTFDQLRCLATRDRKLKTSKRFKVLD